MKSLFSRILMLTLVVTVAGSCKKMLEVQPQSSITGETYFKSEGDFEPYVTGIYSSMRGFANNVTYGLERSEELISASNARFGVAWTQVITPTSGSVNYSAWYSAIGNCNLLLERIKDFSFTARPADKSRIMAETYALRAYFYFHLTMVIGDAPLMLTAVVDENVPLLPRSPAADVIKQVNSDLDSAVLLFKANPSFSAGLYPSKYRMSYGAVQAMKADVKMWSAKVLNGGAADLTAALAAIAEVEASNVRLNANFRDVTGLRASTNPEVILAAYYNRDETGNNFVVNALPFLPIVSGAINLDSIPWCASSANGQGAYQISPLSRSLFAVSDKRIPFTWVTERTATTTKISWVTKYPGTKYADDRIPDNDLIMYRWAFMLLLRAEAYAGLDNTVEAVKSLNLVRARAGLPAYAGATDRVSIEKELVSENGRELFMENRRWFDLVRFHFGKAVDLYNYVPNLKGKTTPLFWPLNPTVIALNPNIVQTQGY